MRRSPEWFSPKVVAALENSERMREVYGIIEQEQNAQLWRGNLRRLNQATGELTRTGRRKAIVFAATIGIAAVPGLIVLGGASLATGWLVAEAGALVAAPFVGRLLHADEQIIRRRIERKNERRNVRQITPEALAPAFELSHELITREEIIAWSSSKDVVPRHESDREVSRLVRAVHENVVASRRSSLAKSDDILKETARVVLEAQFIAQRQRGSIFRQALPNLFGLILTLGGTTYLNKTIHFGLGGLATVVDDFALYTAVPIFRKLTTAATNIFDKIPETTRRFLKI